MRDYLLEIETGAGEAAAVYLERHERALALDAAGRLSIVPLAAARVPLALLRRNPEGYQIERCEGVVLRLNGRAQARSRLVEGDRVELDGHCLTFRSRQQNAPVVVDGEATMHRQVMIRSTGSLRKGFSDGALSPRMAVLFRIWDMLHLGRAEEEVSRQLVEILFQAVPVRRGVVALRNQEGAYETLTARNDDANEDPIVLPAAILERVEQHGRAMLACGDADRPVLSVICVPLVVGDEQVGVVYLDNPERVRDFGLEDLEYCSLLAELAGMTMHNHQLQEQQLFKLNQQLLERQRKIARDLELAHQVQRSLLPQPLDEERIEVAVRYLPMSDVGGDLLIVEPARRGRTFIGICDVSGHGMAAALMASRIAGEVRLRARRGEPLPELIRELNTMLHRAYGKMGLFATLLGGYIDHEQRQLELISAGHVPLIQRHRGAMRQYTSRNMPLGMLPDCLDEDPVQIASLAVGDLLLLYCDGFLESRTQEGAYLGPDQLLAAFAEHAADDASAEAIADGLLAHEGRHRGGELHDDLSMLVVKILG